MFSFLRTFAQMNTEILTLNSLTTGYGSRRQRYVVARELTASLPAGSFTALIGTNGSGKSTLLRTLAGLQPALEGEVRWLGKPLNGYSRRELSQTLAVVLTGRNLGEGLTAREVVEMGRMPYTGFDGRMNDEDRNIVTEAMALTGVTELSRRAMNSLSDGERQRVMIAKALAQQTPVILLDEPTAFLDFPSKVTLLRLLSRLAKEHGKTILMSTHDLELTFQIVGLLWLLSPEGLVEGSPRELADNGMLEQFFHTEGLTFDRDLLRFCLV